MNEWARLELFGMGALVGKVESLLACSPERPERVAGDLPPHHEQCAHGSTLDVAVLEVQRALDTNVSTNRCLKRASAG